MLDSDSLSNPTKPETTSPLRLVGLGLAVIATRLPFLEAGYGTDPDSWRVALAAQEIAATGHYTASRLPGYPVQELLSSLLAAGGPWALNGLSALMAAAAAVFFALIMSHRRLPRPCTAAFALVCVPAVYIASTATIDYVWALAFFLAAFHFALLGRPVAAGVAMGLAIGCRLTTVIMLLPLIVTLYHQRKTIKDMVLLLLSGLGVAALAYLPVALAYGGDFLHAVVRGYPGWITVLKRATVEVWGRIGLGAILICGAGLLVLPGRFGRKPTGVTSGSEQSRTPWWIAIGAVVILFLWLPYEAGYLVPAVPFVFLLLAGRLRRKLFLAFCLAVIVSPFVQICRSAGICTGPILAAHHRRVEITEYTNRIIEAASELSPGSVIVAGWYLPQIEATLAGGEIPGVRFVYLLAPAEAEEAAQQGEEIWYLKDMHAFNMDVHGVSLQSIGKRLPLEP